MKNTSPQSQWKSGKFLLGLVMALASLSHLNIATAATLANSPLFLTASQPPLIMLTMARDHKLYYEAYNDYSDLNSDGTLDVGYKPNSIEYYGYFDSYKCYSYASGLFTPEGMSDQVGTTYTKKCSGSGRDSLWSGDFLNYVTTARIDALRKVLFGGYRSTDNSTQTILERTFIPQDAHSWGKEYKSVADDGYDIREYTPLALPDTGKRHLFANVTLTGFGEAPLMRVLDNSLIRIWEWVSIERPVAGSKCAPGNGSKIDCVTSATSTSSSPGSTPAFQTMIDTFANSEHQTGVQNVSTINQSGSNLNPFTTTDEYYLDVFKGTLNVSSSGDYEFSIDGDDAVELLVDGVFVVGWYSGHAKCGAATTCRDAHKATVINLTTGSHTIEFRHHEQTGGEAWALYWKGADSGSAWEIIPAGKLSALTQTFYNTATTASAMTDYYVRVEVCKTISGLTSEVAFGREANCKAYSNGTTTLYKPTGVLHNYGENNGMFFGLLTGSYDQNTNGGVLRKAISSITNEIELTTGVFKESGSTCGTDGSTACVIGVIGSINRLHVTGFRYSDQHYTENCSFLVTRQMTAGECPMWGNPLAEMMYEATRYFSGASAATPNFITSRARDDAVTLAGGTSGLPRVTSWTDPYTGTPTIPIPNSGPFPSCSKPFLMLISDVYPSFDSDSLPGAANFGSGASASASINGATLDVSARGQSLWNLEFPTAGSQNVFIGQVGTTTDGAPTPKTVSSFGNIRGLSPSDPTRQGSYYAASIANFGRVIDLNAVNNLQTLGTYSIALAAPLPTIEITNIAGKKVTIVPFAKSVGGNSISAAQGSFQPTNQIVDFYVDTIKNTTSNNIDAINGGRAYYKFRINYEDVEQGNDHDMDAIAVYEVFLNEDDSVTIKVDSIYAGGSVIQHMGYVISGTTADGIYLVVRDKDTGYSADPEYFLDRPNSTDSGADSSHHLPLLSSADVDVPNASNYASRTFTANSTGTSAVTLNDPLWYAAKYGGFNDVNGDGIPQSNEWDADGDGVPDTYFLVVNPLKLLAQLNTALSKIKDTSGTGAAATANSYQLSGDTRLYVTRYNSDGWGGELLAYPITDSGAGVAVWQAERVLAQKSPALRAILTYDPDKAGTTKGIPFRWNSMASSGTTTLRTSLNQTSLGVVDSLGPDRVSFLRGEAITGMRTRPEIISTKIVGTCSGTYTCPTGGGTAICSGGGSVECTPTNLPNLLGDIVYSQAQYVARPNSGLADASYANFASDFNSSSNSNGKGNRTPMVYVGANDGMLHGFNASTGEELLAYVPGEMYRQRNSRWILNKLSEVDYGKSGSSNAHRYYVNGTPTIGDICTTDDVSLCPEGNWRSLLVGSLGAGGQGIFALDVTDPSEFSESNASTLVKWEFSDKNDNDMGFSIGRPYVVRICTDRASGGSCEAWSWFVLINNGYSNRESDGHVSSTGDAALFVLNANTGALVKKINVGAGDVSTSGPNGLSEIAPLDLDGDGIVDYVYAGDLKGNLWRFDFLDDNTNNWKVSLGTSANPAPIYVAKDQQSTPVLQPITTAPDAILHPQGGFLVSFGTGSYVFENDDQSSQAQTIYGLWDKLDGSTISSSSRSNLLQQEFSIALEIDGSTYRTVSTNTIDWATANGWYLNFPENKERLGFNPEIIGGKIFRFKSIVPSNDICASGGDSWETFIDALSGGRLTWSVFMASGGKHDFGDVNGYASSRKSKVGITPPGAIFKNPKGRDFETDYGSSGTEKIEKDLGGAKAGRIGWREILTD